MTPRSRTSRLRRVVGTVVAPGRGDSRRGDSRRGDSRRGGHTLIELIVAMASAGILVAGLASAVLITSRGFRPETTTQHERADAALVEAQLLNDLRLARSFTERTENAVTFTVPDRTGDGRPETLRYAWSGTPDDPLTLSLNGGSPMIRVRQVRSFSLRYVTHTVEADRLGDDEDDDDEDD